MHTWNWKLLLQGSISQMRKVQEMGYFQHVPRWKWNTFSFLVKRGTHERPQVSSEVSGSHLFLLLIFLSLCDILLQSFPGLQVSLRTRIFRCDFKTVERKGRSFGLGDMESAWKTPFYCVALDKLLTSHEFKVSEMIHIHALYIIELFWEMGETSGILKVNPRGLSIGHSRFPWLSSGTVSLALKWPLQAQGPEL